MQSRTFIPPVGVSFCQRASFFLEKVVFIVLHFGVEADPPNIDMFQVNNRNNGKRCEIYSKLKNKNTRTTKSILLRDWIFKSMFVDQ